MLRLVRIVKLYKHAHQAIEDSDVNFLSKLGKKQGTNTDAQVVPAETM